MKGTINEVKRFWAMWSEMKFCSFSLKINFLFFDNVFLKVRKKKRIFKNPVKMKSNIDIRSIYNSNNPKFVFLSAHFTFLSFFSLAKSRNTKYFLCSTPKGTVALLYHHRDSQFSNRITPRKWKNFNRKKIFSIRRRTNICPWKMITTRAKFVETLLDRISDHRLFLF